MKYVKFQFCDEYSSKEDWLQLLRNGNFVQVFTMNFQRIAEILEIFGKNAWCLNTATMMLITDFSMVMLGLFDNLLKYCEDDVCLELDGELYGDGVKTC